jgi:hypothetical protein
VRSGVGWSNFLRAQLSQPGMDRPRTHPLLQCQSRVRPQHSLPDQLMVRLQWALMASMRWMALGLEKHLTRKVSTQRTNVARLAKLAGAIVGIRSGTVDVDFGVQHGCGGAAGVA